METAHSRLGILISGRGSNMMSIVAACDSGRLPAEVAIVISNKEHAAGLQWAHDRGIATAVFRHTDYADREGHDRAVVACLLDRGVDWVCLAGYMRLLSPFFVKAYPDRILNIHPSLLPSFRGLDAQQQAWEYGVKVTGCTVHIVDAELDHGPIVVQRTVLVSGGETPEELAERILVEEHQAYPEALHLLLSRQWTFKNRRFVLRNHLGIGDLSE